MRTLITFPLDSGILGMLEYVASAICEFEGEDIIARSPMVEVHIPGASSRRRSTLDITHLIDESELDNITSKIIEAFWVRHDSTTRSEYTN